MKNRIKKLITLGVLTLTLTINPLVVFAEDVQEPTQTEESIEGNTSNEQIAQYNQEEPTKPEEPTGENVTNEQIVQYNQEVDNYNQQVDEYNVQIDNNYEQEKANIDAQNAVIDEYNKAEDAKAAAVQEENEQLQNKYNEDYAQYEQDLNKYEKKEQQILGLGYKSVEQYNDMVNAYYNEPCEAGEAGNIKEENTFDIKQSYKIEKVETAEDQDPEEEPIEDEHKTYKVEIEHNFIDAGVTIKTYKDEFEIDENDIVTFMPAGTQLEVYKNDYHYGFFAKIDDEHIKGYWYSSSSILEELCNYLESDWDTGNIYIVSYKDGQSKPGDPNLKMVYNYSWKALKKVATYTKPNEPQLELKEEYIPEYKEKLADPEKKEYLTHLNHLDLKEENNSQPEEEKKQDNSNEQNSSNEPNNSNESSSYVPLVDTVTSIKPVDEIDRKIMVGEEEPISRPLVGNVHIIAPQTGDNSELAIRIIAILFLIGIILIIYNVKNLRK